MWQRRGRAVFWGSFGKLEEEVGECWAVEEGGVSLWEEEVVSWFGEVEGVFWMGVEEVMREVGTLLHVILCYHPVL